jgi:hypothetical protein
VTEVWHPINKHEEPGRPVKTGRRDTDNATSTTTSSVSLSLSEHELPNEESVRAKYSATTWQKPSLSIYANNDNWPQQSIRQRITSLTIEVTGKVTINDLLCPDTNQTRETRNPKMSISYLLCRPIQFGSKRVILSSPERSNRQGITGSVVSIPPHLSR